jgi:excinuclease ABC subunit C
MKEGDVGFSKIPDLILLDGGATHVSVVRRLMEEIGISVPVFGMVKDEYHKTRALCTEHEEISIAKDRALFTVIYRI